MAIVGTERGHAVQVSATRIEARARQIGYRQQRNEAMEESPTSIIFFKYGLKR
jgi:hypothetical protein